jgi:hypothetical protein
MWATDTRSAHLAGKSSRALHIRHEATCFICAARSDEREPHRADAQRRRRFPRHIICDTVTSSVSVKA